jgi:hypothetical protein
MARPRKRPHGTRTLPFVNPFDQLIKGGHLAFEDQKRLGGASLREIQASYALLRTRRRKPKQIPVNVNPTSVSQIEEGTGVIAGVVPGVTLQLLITAVSVSEPSAPVIPTYAVSPPTAFTKLIEPDRIWLPSK